MTLTNIPEIHIKNVSRDLLGPLTMFFNQRFSKDLNIYASPLPSGLLEQVGDTYKVAGMVKAIVLQDRAPAKALGIEISKSRRGFIRNAPDTGIVIDCEDKSLVGKRAIVPLGLSPATMLADGERIKFCGIGEVTYDTIKPLSIPLDRLIVGVIDGSGSDMKIRPYGRNILAKRHKQMVSAGGILMDNMRNTRVVYEAVSVGGDVEGVKPGQIMLVAPSAVLPVKIMDDLSEDNLFLLPEYGIISIVEV